VTLYVVLLVCAVNQPCDKTHYVDFQAFRAEPGVIICGVPATMQIVQSARAPGEGYYIRQRCELRRD
jgi:hypothetical protein